MLMDIRFQMLDGERAQPILAPRIDIPSVIVQEPQPAIIPHPRMPEPVAHAPEFMTMPTPSKTPSAIIEEPKPVVPYSVSFPQPQMDDLGTHAPGMHARSLSSGSSPVLFVPPTSLFFLYSNTAQAFPTPHSTSGLFRTR